MNQHEMQGKLLNEILIRIEIYGGRDRLARDIEEEWKRPASNHWQPHEVRVLLTNIYDYEKVSRLTGRTIAAVESKMKQIRERNKLKQLLFK